VDRNNQELLDELELSNEISAIKGIFYGVLGTFIRVLFGLIINIILARILGKEDYGIWVLSNLLIAFIIMISMCGFSEGIPRFIGRYRGNNEIHKINSLLKHGFRFIIIWSFFISTIFFVLIPIIADVLRIQQISRPLQLLAIAIIPITLTNIISSVFRGLERIKIEQLIQRYINLPLWFIVLLILTRIDFQLNSICIYYLISCYILLLISVFLFHREIKHIFKSNNKTYKVSNNETKKLIFFSSPLLLSGFMIFIKTKTDVFMLGYFKNLEAVAIYNVAFKIASLTPFILSAAVGIFMPIASKLIKKDIAILNDFYQRVTKWSVFPTLILILVIFHFPEIFLKLFGDQYLQASTPLKILLLTYLIHAIFGPNGALNVALGDTKFIAYYSFFGAITNILLNYFLIPRFGVSGAAFASFISVLLMNLIASFKLYYLNKLSPFTKEYIAFLIIIPFAYIIKKISVVLNFPGFITIVLFIIIVISIELVLIWKLNLLDAKDKVLINGIVKAIK